MDDQMCIVLTINNTDGTLKEENNNIDGIRKINLIVVHIDTYYLSVQNACRHMH